MLPSLRNFRSRSESRSNSIRTLRRHACSRDKDPHKTADADYQRESGVANAFEDELAALQVTRADSRAIRSTTAPASLALAAARILEPLVISAHGERAGYRKPA